MHAFTLNILKYVALYCLEQFILFIHLHKQQNESSLKKMEKWRQHHKRPTDQT